MAGTLEDVEVIWALTESVQEGWCYHAYLYDR